MKNLAAWNAIGCLLLTLLVTGCGGDSDSESGADGPSYGELPGLRATANAELQEELARLDAEAATPLLLTGCELSAGQNVAVGLSLLFPIEDQATIRAASDTIMPQGAFELTPTQLDAARAFFVRYRVPWEGSRAAVRRPKCNLKIRHDLGLEADLSVVEVFWICARLEAFHVADALNTLDTREAIISLSHMFRLAACLAQEKHLTTRLEAAYMRTEALSVAQEIVNNEGFTPGDLRSLRQLVSNELDNWSDDRGAWIGDRSLGLCVYEAARAGCVDRALTPQEAEGLAEEGILDQLEDLSGDTLEQDQLYYLRVMRTLIAACDQPYYARVALIEELRADLAVRWNTPDFPLLAGRVLLPSVGAGSEIQARDRANMEAWRLATTLGIGLDAPSERTNPLTGREYSVDYKEDPMSTWPGMIVVTGVGTGRRGDNAPVIVPDFSQSAEAAP